MAENGSSMVRLSLDDPVWQAFVGAQAEATPFHHPAWATLIAECYGYDSFALALRESDEIVAGLPVIEVTRPFGPTRWVSLPFTDVLPMLGRPDATTRLGEELRAVRARGTVDAIEVRAPLSGAAEHAAAVIHELALADDPEELLARLKGSQARRGVVKAEREGVTIRRGDRSEDLTEQFFRLHVDTRRRQGVPVQPRRYFELLWRHLVEPGLGYVLVAESHGRPIAAAVFLDWNGTVIYKYGASDPRALGLRPNNLLFWTAIRAACEAGRHTLDFGRTDFENDGLRRFKRGWGAEERPLVYSELSIRPTSDGGGHGWIGSAAETIIRHSPRFVCRVAGELLYRYAA